MTNVQILVISNTDGFVKSVNYCSNFKTRSEIADDSITHLYFLGTDEFQDDQITEEISESVYHVIRTKQEVGSSFMFTDEGGFYIINFI